MKTHKAPRKPGMHSVHDQKGSSARAVHNTGGVPTKTLIIIGAITVVVLLLMYFSMVA